MDFFVMEEKISGISPGTQPRYLTPGRWQP